MCIYISPSLHTTTTTTKHNPLPSGGPDAEMVGGLSAGSGNRGPPGGRAIEELEIDEGTTPPPPRVLVHSRSYHDKVWGGRALLK